MHERQGKPRILLLCRYGARAASSRLRHLVFVSALDRAGYQVTIDSLLDERQIDAAHNGHSRPLASLLAAYLRRGRSLLIDGPWDFIWLEKEVWPFIPLFLERLALSRAAHVVLDLDDPWHLRYERSPSKLVRGILGQKIVNLGRVVDVVTTANPVGASQLHDRGLDNVMVLGPHIDISRSKVRQNLKQKDTTLPVVGWIGSPQTAAEYLPIVAPVLNRLQREGACSVVLIGAGESALQLNADRKIWSIDTEAEDVSQFDVLVAPLNDTEWDRARSGYKVLQAFAAAVPVIASRVGFMEILIDNRVDGVLVSNTDADWYSAIKELLSDTKLRSDIGLAGRQKAMQHYHIEGAAAAVVSLFDTLLGKRTAPFL